MYFSPIRAVFEVPSVIWASRTSLPLEDESILPLGNPSSIEANRSLTGGATFPSRHAVAGIRRIVRTGNLAVSLATTPQVLGKRTVPHHGIQAWFTPGRTSEQVDGSLHELQHLRLSLRPVGNSCHKVAQRLLFDIRQDAERPSPRLITAVAPVGIGLPSPPPSRCRQMRMRAFVVQAGESHLFEVVLAGVAPGCLSAPLAPRAVAALRGCR